MSERVLDARHGHGGVEECDRTAAMAWVRWYQENHAYISDEAIENLVDLFAAHRLASNPSPEPEDAEVEAAIGRLRIAVDRTWATMWEGDIDRVIAAYRRLRSQAGQGRVTEQTITDWLDEYDPPTGEKVRALLSTPSAQEPREP